MTSTLSLYTENSTVENSPFYCNVCVSTHRAPQPAGSLPSLPEAFAHGYVRTCLPPAFSTLAVGSTMMILVIVLFPCSFAAVQPEPHADELASQEALLSTPSNLAREDVLETQTRTHTTPGGAAQEAS